MRTFDAPALPLERAVRRGAEALGRPVEPLRVPLERAPDASCQCFARAVETSRHYRELRDDEPAGHRRRGRTHVRGEVAQRRVLLVAHGRDDRHGGRGDCADEALVAEREQVLEAAAAAREDDHVDVRLLGERAERVDDPERGPRALDVRLGDENVRRGKPALDRRDDVLLRGCVVAGDETDPPREQRQRPLALVREEPFRGERRLQPLERGEMRAEAEALDRQRPQAQVAALLEQLRASEDVNALAVGELELQRVETAARHRDADRGAAVRVLEREEHARPALVAPELGDLALDPHRREPAEPLRDAAVERGDGVDLPVLVRQRLDLHGRSQPGC